MMAALDSFDGVRYSGFHLRNRSILLNPSDLAKASSPVNWTLVRDHLDHAAKASQYVTAHMWGDPRLFEILDELGYVALFLIRDPRDVVISSAAYIARLGRHIRHRHFVEEYSTQSERLRAIIEGYPPSTESPGLPSLAERLQGYTPWLSAPGVMCCRFEDLVGDRGGGSSEIQVPLIIDIGHHIGRHVTVPEAHRIASTAWSPGAATFRAGVIGQWRQQFDERTKAVFAEAIGEELMACLGYDT